MIYTDIASSSLRELDAVALATNVTVFMERDPKQVPATLGYCMPAEWHPHESTWLVWPKNPLTWPDRVAEVQELYLQIMTLLAFQERVDLLVDDLDTADVVAGKLRKRNAALEQIAFHPIKTADSWIRDYGPNFLLRRTQGKAELAFNHWRFNAWGNKYEDLKRDEVIPAQLEPLLKVPRFAPELVLEGGSIEVNGEGLCLTTEECLLSPNRNPGKSKSEVEQFLRDYLGVQQIAWLRGGIPGDDTDGHVDNLARFVNPGTIVCALENDPSDESYETLQENYQRLQAILDGHGAPIEVIRLPMPGRLQTAQGRLPASYTNFYIANGMVLFPTFAQDNDAQAADILQKLFPTRKVIGMDCRSAVWGLGTLHCLTQQQPALSLF